MFNLPWYSWFNVLALPGLWAALSLNGALAGQPDWLHKLMSIQVIAAAVIIFLYWNPTISDGYTVLHYALALLVMPMLIWHIGAVLIELCKCTWISLMAWSKPVKTTAPDALQLADTGTGTGTGTGDDIDLDGGESPLERERQIGNALSSLLSRQSSMSSKMRSMGKLFGEPDATEIAEHCSAYLSGLLIYGMFLIVVLLAPGYMSLSLSGLLS